MKNMGSIDRTVRAILGVGLVAAAVILQVSTGGFWWLGIPGLLFLGTSAVATCPVYIPLGITTIPTGKVKR